MMHLRSILESRRAEPGRRPSRLSRPGREVFRPALMTPMTFGRRRPDEAAGEPLGANVEARLSAMPDSTARNVGDACDEGFGAGARA